MRTYVKAEEETNQYKGKALLVRVFCYYYYYYFLLEKAPWRLFSQCQSHGQYKACHITGAQQILPGDSLNQHA